MNVTALVEVAHILPRAYIRRGRLDNEMGAPRVGKRELTTAVSR